MSQERLCFGPQGKRSSPHAIDWTYNERGEDESGPASQ